MTNVHPTAEDLPPAVREAVSSFLAADEVFLGGVDCRDGVLLSEWRSTTLLLTDRRVIEYRRGVLRGSTVEYGRDSVTTASVSMGLLYHRLTLAGPGLERSFRIDPAAGRQFADAVRSDDPRRIDDASYFERLRESVGGDVPSDAEATPPTSDDHWTHWHYVLVLATAVTLIGAVISSLPVLALGYLSIPVTTYLDIRYVQSRGDWWNPDVGLYLIGGILFPLISVPMYLYRRHETIGL